MMNLARRSVWVKESCGLVEKGEMLDEVKGITTSASTRERS